MSCYSQVCDAVLSFLRYVSPSVIAVILGGFIFQQYFVARANECSFIDYLITGLDELRSDVFEYWSLDVNAKNRNQARFLEAKIKGAIKSLTSELRSYSQRYCSRTDFGPLMIEVSDACTGGQFEVAERSADSGRYLSVVNSLHRVKYELMRRKL